MAKFSDVHDADDHAAIEILGLTTAETDDALVLAPDGAGGVEFRAETGGGGSTPPDCLESVITTDVTMGTANTWTDSGLSLSLAAGTWLVEATLMIRTTQTGVEFVGIRLTNSDASTIYMNNGMNLLSNNGQENTLHCRKRITVGSTTTVKVQGIGEARTGVICADSADATQQDNTISNMTALKVTSA